MYTYIRLLCLCTVPYARSADGVHGARMEYLGKGWSRGKVEIPRQVLPAPRHLAAPRNCFSRYHYHYLHGGTPHCPPACHVSAPTQPVVLEKKRRRKKKKTWGMIRDWIAGFSGSHYFLPSWFPLSAKRGPPLFPYVVPYSTYRVRSTCTRKESLFARPRR